MKKRIISLVLCIVLLAFSCPTAYAKPTNDEIDAQARGTDSYAASMGKTIYYISDGWIYSMNSAGKNKKKEVFIGTSTKNETTETMWGLQSYNGYLYYTRSIFDMSKWDTMAELYPIERGNLYRYKPGGKPSVFQTNVTGFIIGGNTLYYGTPSGLYIKSINLDTGKKATLVQGNDKYKLHIVNFLEDVLVIGVTTPDNDFFALYNPKTKKLVEHRELDWRSSYVLQTAGDYLYNYDIDSGCLYRSILNHSTLEITDWEAVYLGVTIYDSGNEIFISGNYVYYKKVNSSSGGASWYKSHLSNGQTTLVCSVGDREWLNILEPCGNYIHSWDCSGIILPEPLEGPWPVYEKMYSK